MRSIMRNIAFAAVALLYIVSTMGYGVHKCSTDGTASLILLFGETPCEFVHSHIDSDGNTYSHSHAPGEHHHTHDCQDEHCGSHEFDGEHHSSDCCSTNVYVLTEDQDITSEDNSFAPDFHFVYSGIPCESELLASASVPAKHIPYSFKIFPSLESAQAVLCTFRI